jgi:hypothetical protein
VAEKLGVDPSMIVLPNSNGRRAEIVFQIVGEASEIASLTDTLAASGVVMQEVEEDEDQMAEGEVWEEVNGQYILTKCPSGRILQEFPEYECKECDANSYALEGSTSCMKCPAGADCLEDACLQPGCLGNVTFRPLVSGSTWSRQNQSGGSIAFRITSCPVGTTLIRSENNILGDECQACPTGQFGLEVSEWTGNASKAVCQECRPGFNCSRGGRNVSPQRGFWMNPHGVLESPQNVSMHDPKMKWKASRRDSAAPWQPVAVPCAQGACLSNWSCREGHEGRLCALCKDTSPNGNFYAMGASGCVECEESGRAIATIIAVLCAIVALLAYYVAVWSPLIGSQTLKRAFKYSHEAAQSAVDLMMRRIFKKGGESGGDSSKKDSNFTGYFKIIIGFCQVTAAFLSNLEVDWPSTLAQMMAVFAIVNLDFFTLPTTECVFSSITHQTKLIVCTTVPLAVLALLAIPAAIARVTNWGVFEWKEIGSRRPKLGEEITNDALAEALEQQLRFTSKEWKRFNMPTQTLASNCYIKVGNKYFQRADKTRPVISAFFFSVLTFMFVIYPFVSNVVVGVFNCVELDLYDQFEGHGSWLKSDLREPCPALSDSITFAWGLIFLVVYPIGIPLLFVMTLYYFKVPQLATNKGKMHRLKAVLQKMGAFNSRQFKEWKGKQEPVEFLKASQCKLLLKYQFEGHEAFEFENASEAAQAIFLSNLESPQDGASLVVDDPLHELRRQTAMKVDFLCREQIVAVPPITWNGESGEDEKNAIEYCGFVFVTYEAQYWWFEVFEMLRKLALSALLIFVGDANVRVAVGFLISFIGLLVVGSTRPFVSPSLDVLMAVALITQTLTLSYGLMLIVKSQAEADAATRSDMDFLEWVIVILNGAIFAIPIFHSFVEDVLSALVEKLSRSKYTDDDIEDSQDSVSERSQISSSVCFAAAKHSAQDPEPAEISSSLVDRETPQIISSRDLGQGTQNQLGSVSRQASSQPEYLLSDLVFTGQRTYDELCQHLSMGMGAAVDDSAGKDKEVVFKGICRVCKRPVTSKHARSKEIRGGYIQKHYRIWRSM